jgi:hypothetical protein
MPFLQSRLKPIVIANAAAMNTLIADLNSGTFAAREAATKQLHALGEQTEPGIRAALKGDTPLEARRWFLSTYDAARLTMALAHIGYCRRSWGRCRQSAFR